MADKTKCGENDLAEQELEDILKEEPGGTLVRGESLLGRDLNDILLYDYVEEQYEGVFQGVTDLVGNPSLSYCEKYYGRHGTIILHRHKRRQQRMLFLIVGPSGQVEDYLHASAGKRYLWEKGQLIYVSSRHIYAFALDKQDQP